MILIKFYKLDKTLFQKDVTKHKNIHQIPMRLHFIDILMIAAYLVMMVMLGFITEKGKTE